MDMKERLKTILEKEFGITTEEQLNEAYEKIDTSIYGIFVLKEGESLDVA